MSNDVLEKNGTDDMISSNDMFRLHERMDTMVQKFENSVKEIDEKLDNIRTDVTIIKQTCEMRGETCSKHVLELDKIIRDRNGLLTRVSTVEQNSTGKEKFAWLTIGALVAGAISLIIALAFHLLAR